MTCGHYEREGRLLVEQGLPDPHRDACADCRRVHSAHENVVGALAEVAAHDTSDTAWQADVWRQIARDERASSGRRVLRMPRIAIAVAVTAALLIVWWVKRDPPSHERVVIDRPRIEILSGATAMRSTSARVGDRVRVLVSHGDTVWIYRGDRLIARCPATPGICTDDPDGSLAELELSVAGDYQIVIVTTTLIPEGLLDRDLAKVVGAGGRYQLTELAVR